MSQSQCKQKDEGKDGVLPHKIMRRCRRAVFFRALLDHKKLKICVYFCDGYREFFTLCLIRGRVRMRMKDGGECGESEETSVCVRECLCPVSVTSLSQ